MGILDPSNPDHARAAEQLRTDRILWLATVRPDGQPQTVPVWFLWEDAGGSILVYSQRDKPKLANIAANPRVSVHLRGTETGADVVILEGSAAISEDQPPADRVAPYIEKYRTEIDGYGWTPASFAADYSVPLRITPDTLRLW